MGFFSEGSVSSWFESGRWAGLDGWLLGTVCVHFSVFSPFHEYRHTCDHDI